MKTEVYSWRVSTELKTGLEREARRRNIELVVEPTAEAIRTLQENPDETNAILHVTC